MYSEPWGKGYKTENAATVIVQGSESRQGMLTYMTYLHYTAPATDHTITIMASQGNTTLAAAASAGAATVTITADPGPSGNAIATGDFVGIRKPDGNWFFTTVTVAGLVMTLGTVVPTGGFASGAKFCMFGAAADSFHAAHTFKADATGDNFFPDSAGPSPAGCLRRSTGADEPLLVHSDNIANAGSIELMSGVFGRPVG